VNAKLGVGSARQGLVDEDFGTATCDLHGDNADGHRQPCPDADHGTVAVTLEEGMSVSLMKLLWS